MVSPSDLLVIGAVVAAVVWLDMPRLLVPALFLAVGAVSLSHWPICCHCLAPWPLRSRT